jgi:hypothetical protein
MDWFERITGFLEQGYAATQARLMLDGDALVSADGRRWGIGQLALCTLHTLRERRAAATSDTPRTTVRCLAADARALHADPALRGALFQVASQFNLLEMVAPDVTPEHGVTRYAHDRTQGPACAMAAGAATIYRNYLVPMDGGRGQTAARQIDALAPLGRVLAEQSGVPVSDLWTMRNGYAMASATGLAAVGRLLREADEATRDTWRGELAVGLHQDVQVTDAAAADDQPCRWPTPASGPHCGSRWPGWCWKRRTKPRCSRPHCSGAAAVRPRCC